MIATQEAQELAVDFPLQPRQLEAIQCLRDPDVREVLFGGGKGPGKSHLGVVWMFEEGMADIERYGLEPCEFPIATGFMGRCKSTLFTTSTLETWKRVIPRQFYRIREQAKQIVIMEAVAINFGGMDAEMGVQKFGSTGYARAFIDEAHEVTRNDIMALRAMRLRINGQFPAYKFLFCSNPARTWLRDEFILAPKPYQRYVPALHRDNRFLPPNYVEQITEAYSHRPELLEAFLNGRWDVFEGMNQAIREADVDAARDRQHYPSVRHKIVVCDAAREGDDETVIYGMDETQIIKEEIYSRQNAMYTANHLFVMWRDFDAELVAIDSIGLGGPIGDRLIEMGVPVLMINSAEKSGEPERYVNLRAEMWDQAGKMFAAGDVALSHDDARLRAELCTPTYDFRSGRMIIQDKDEIKKLLDKSPDRGDTYVYGLHALRYLRRELLRPGAGMVMHKPTEKPEVIPERSYLGRRKARDDKRQAAMADTW